MKTEREIQQYRDQIERRRDEDDEDFRLMEAVGATLDWVLGDAGEPA